MSEPIKLPDEPREALREVASYLRTVRNGADRRHYQSIGPEGLGKEFVGYWQTPEWIDGLLEIAVEAERIGGGNNGQ